MTAPVCVTCGALTYYIASDRKHYCITHISNQESHLFNKHLSVEIVRRARAILAEVDHRSTLEAISIEDSDWEDLDLWKNVSYFWDLNIFTSPNGLICGTLYPVNEDGQTLTQHRFPIVSDPSAEEVLKNGSKG